MKKLMYLVMSIAMSLFAADASAQYIPVTTPSSCIVDGSGSTITAGTMIVVGTDANDNPIPYRAGTSAMATTAPISRSIVNGALLTSLQLADPASTSPTNVLYRFVIQDNLSKKITVYKQIIVAINDLGTNFNFCKMNPLPFTTQIQFAAAPFSFSGDWNLLGHLSVALSSTFAASLTATTPGSGSFIARSGATGSNVTGLSIGRTTDEVQLGVPATTGQYFTQATTGDLIIRNQAANIYIGSGTGAAPIGITTDRLKFYTTLGTLPAAILNDTAGGVQVTNNAGQSNRLIDASGNMYVGAGKALILFGGTSGSTAITASPVAGSTSLAVPAVNGTFVIDSATQTLSAKTLDHPIITTGVSQGSGFKHQRFGTLCTTAASAGANCTTAVTWTSAFTDSSYTPVCVGVTASNAPALTIEAVTASGFTIRIFAIVASASTFTTVDCTAVHD